jgi:hypothetical protein
MFGERSELPGGYGGSSPRVAMHASLTRLAGFARARSWTPVDQVVTSSCLEAEADLAKPKAPG